MNCISKDRQTNFHLVKEIMDKAMKLGIFINEEKLFNLADDYEQKLSEYKKELYDLTYEGFNPRSPGDLRGLFERKDWMKYAERTKTGFSFNAEVLEKVVANEPDAREAFLIKEIRSIESVLNKIKEFAIHIDNKGFIHPRWQFGETNRIYYNNPGLSNIPDEVRSCLTAPEGYVLAILDYKQQEPWILFNWLKIKPLLDLLEKDDDVYRALARYVMDKEEITEEERKKIKIAWLATSYGASQYTVAKQVGDEFAERFISRIESIPEIKQKKAEIWQNVRKGQLKAVSYFGNIRILEKSNNIERQMFNNPIQMTGSDILMFALEDIHNYLQEHNYTEEEARVYFTLHDEIVLLVNEMSVPVIFDIKDLIEYKVDDWKPFKLDLEITKEYK